MDSNSGLSINMCNAAHPARTVPNVLITQPSWWLMRASRLKEGIQPVTIIIPVQPNLVVITTWAGSEPHHIPFAIKSLSSTIYFEGLCKSMVVKVKDSSTRLVKKQRVKCFWSMYGSMSFSLASWRKVKHFGSWKARVGVKKTVSLRGQPQWLKDPIKSYDVMRVEWYDDDSLCRNLLTTDWSQDASEKKSVGIGFFVRLRPKQKMPLLPAGAIVPSTQSPGFKALLYNDNEPVMLRTRVKVRYLDILSQSSCHQSPD